MSTVIPIRRHQPTPTTGADPTAEVVPLHPTRTQRASRWPTRRPIAGHHPDCPYAHRGAPVDHCGPCQGLRKARPNQETHR